MTKTMPIMVDDYDEDKMMMKERETCLLLMMREGAFEGDVVNYLRKITFLIVVDDDEDK